MTCFPRERLEVSRPSDLIAVESQPKPCTSGTSAVFWQRANSGKSHPRRVLPAEVGVISFMPFHMPRNSDQRSFRSHEASLRQFCELLALLF